MPQFTARLAAVRATPSRADDVKTVTRIVLEAHDISVDPLVEFLGDDVRVTLATVPMPLTPIEQAIDEAEEPSSPRKPSSPRTRAAMVTSR